MSKFGFRFKFMSAFFKAVLLFSKGDNAAREALLVRLSKSMLACEETDTISKRKQSGI